MSPGVDQNELKEQIKYLMEDIFIKMEFESYSQAPFLNKCLIMFMLFVGFYITVRILSDSLSRLINIRQKYGNQMPYSRIIALDAVVVNKFVREVIPENITHLENPSEMEAFREYMICIMFVSRSNSQEIVDQNGTTHNVYGADVHLNYNNTHEIGRYYAEHNGVSSNVFAFGNANNHMILRTNRELYDKIAPKEDKKKTPVTVFVNVKENNDNIKPACGIAVELKEE